MIRFFGLLLLLIPCECARCQQRGTTVIVVGSSKDKIILAADSRATKGDGSHKDDFCKIVELGDDVIFAATGIVSDSSGILPEDIKFDVYSAARKAYSEIKEKSPRAKMSLIVGKSLSDRVALQWSNDFGSHMVAAAKVSDWINRPNGGRIIGIFVATEAKEMDAVVATLNCTPQNIKINCEMEKGPIEIPDVICFEPFGTIDVVQLALLHTSNEWRQFQKKRSENSDQADIEFAIRLVELTEDFSAFKKDVGGKIDAVEVRPGKKPYWIQQKCECKQETSRAH